LVRQLDLLTRDILQLATGRFRPQWIDGVLVFAADRTTAPMISVTDPMLTLVTQGVKRTVLGEHAFEHRPGQVAVVSVDLPLVGEITRASPSEPFVAMGLRLDPATVAQLLVDAGMAPIRHTGPGLAVSDASEELLDAIARLIGLLGRRRDFQVLSAGIRREIHWWLLNGPQAALLRQVGMADSRLALVAGAIAWIRSRYNQLIRIDDLAADIGTSVSSLNRHFRAVTAMSPLQYQKHLRLQQARIALIAAPHDVAGAGYAVGYDNPSQFSREYRRMFGAPPRQDALRLQTMDLVHE
jgi:AraC-like DNA-binding protein